MHANQIEHGNRIGKLDKHVRFSLSRCAVDGDVDLIRTDTKDFDNIDIESIPAYVSNLEDGMVEAGRGPVWSSQSLCAGGEVFFVDGRGWFSWLDAVKEGVEWDALG